MSKFGFDKVLDKIKETKEVLPKELANHAQNFFVASFEKEAWVGDGVYNWTPRKGKTAEERNLLVKTGRLRRAVANSIQIATFEKIRLAVPDNTVPYAKYHNEGATGAGRKHNVTIPQRQFMGNSVILSGELKEKIEKYFNKIWPG